MRVGIISDTHGNLLAVQAAIQVLGEIDLLVHVGDVLYHPPRLGWAEGYDVAKVAAFLNELKMPVLIAQGNCDAPVYEELLNVPMLSPYAYAQIDSVGILASHGHIIGVGQLVELGKRFGASVVVSGHTHVAQLRKEYGILYMNPGSPALSKYEVDGKPVQTVGLLEDEEAYILDVASGEAIFRATIV